MKDANTLIYLLQGLVFTICLVIGACMLMYISNSMKPKKYKTRDEGKRFPGVAFRVCNYHIGMLPKGLMAILVTDGTCHLCAKKSA